MSARTATSFDKAVGGLIRARRLALGVSQTALADVIGVTFQQVQKYEKGTNRISIGTLVEIAAALSTSIQALLPKTVKSGEPEAPLLIQQTRQGADFLEAYEAAHPDDRPRILATAIRAADDLQNARKPLPKKKKGRK